MLSTALTKEYHKGHSDAIGAGGVLRTGCLTQPAVVGVMHNKYLQAMNSEIFALVLCNEKSCEPIDWPLCEEYRDEVCEFV